MPLSTVQPKHDSRRASYRRSTRPQTMARSKPPQGPSLRRSLRLAILQHQHNDVRGSPNYLSGMNLCKRCRSIDFVSIFQVPYHGGAAETVLNLGILEDAAPCPLCRFFYDMRTHDYGRERRTFHLRTRAAGVFGYRPAARTTTNVALEVVPATLLGYEGTYVRPVTRIGQILPLSVEALPTGQVLASLVPPFIDFGLLQAWLAHCDTRHSSHCQRTMPTRAVVHCIDVYSRDVVQVTPGDEYLALSYVWGTTGQDEDPTSASSLQEKVPKVIEDALIVVKKLGIRYLWVDRFCIDQKDAAKRDEQIRSMDQIFEGAYATIAATAGSDCSHGLPGVTDRPRQEQPAVVSPTGALASSLPELRKILNNSTWGTRGWTYQEAFLSRRALFFTDGQVHFVCSSASWCESLVPKPEPEKDDYIPISEIMSTGIQHRGSTCEIGQLAKHIISYTRRTLSYERDALDAFRGLLSRSPYYTYYGIPCWSSSETLMEGSLLEAKILRLGPLGTFIPGLAWEPREPMSLSRRRGFPSWSWAGWSGEIGGSWYKHLGQAFYGLSHEFCLQANIWAANPEGEPIEITCLISSAGDRKILPELSPYIYIDSLLATFQLMDMPDAIPGMCRCLPSSAHPEDFDDGRGATGKISLCQWPPGKTDKGNHRISDWAWDCVLLYETKNDACLHFLVIEWTDGTRETAYKVGTLTMTIEMYKFKELLPVNQHTRRRIRLE